MAVRERKYSKAELLGATGGLVDILDSDQLAFYLPIVRHGSQFMRQWSGKKPGFLFQVILSCVEKKGVGCSFEELLYYLDSESFKADKGRNSIEQVRRFEKKGILVYYLGEKRKTVTFGHLRNRLGKAKKMKILEIHTIGNV